MDAKGVCLSATQRVTKALVGELSKRKLGINRRFSVSGKVT